MAISLPPTKIVFGIWEKFELPRSSDESIADIGGKLSGCEEQSEKVNEPGHQGVLESKDGNGMSKPKGGLSTLEGGSRLPKPEGGSRKEIGREHSKSDLGSRLPRGENGRRTPNPYQGGSRSDYGTLKPSTVSGSTVEKPSKGSSEHEMVKHGGGTRKKELSTPYKDLPSQGKAILTNLTVRGEVWFIPEVWRPLQEKLQHDLSVLALEDQGLFDNNSLVIGERVLALWEDTNWHRGRVVSLLENNALEVFFVDWGNIELVKRDEVVRMANVPDYAKLESVHDLAVEGYLQKVLYMKTYLRQISLIAHLQYTSDLGSLILVE